jgi:hypothetical protein
MMALDVDQYRLDRVTDESKDTQQDVHRTLPIPTRIPKFILPSRSRLRDLRETVAALESISSLFDERSLSRHPNSV